jgi:hypothetical protein
VVVQEAAELTPCVGLEPVAVQLSSRYRERNDKNLSTIENRLNEREIEPEGPRLAYRGGRDFDGDSSKFDKVINTLPESWINGGDINHLADCGFHLKLFLVAGTAWL